MFGQGAKVVAARGGVAELWRAAGPGYIHVLFVLQILLEASCTTCLVLLPNLLGKRWRDSFGDALGWMGGGHGEAPGEIPCEILEEALGDIPGAVLGEEFGKLLGRLLVGLLGKFLGGGSSRTT